MKNTLKISVTLLGSFFLLLTTAAMSDQSTIKNADNFNQANASNLLHAKEFISSTTLKNTVALKKWDEELIIAGLSKDEFESYLSDQYYGTYFFYKTLDVSAAEAVYQKYAASKNPEVAKIRSEITAALKARN